MLLIGDYTVLGKVATGGMGTVYVAERTGPGGFRKLVAIKKLHPFLEIDAEARKRFIAEARIGAALDHPNIVSVIDLVEDGVELHIVMEFVHGCTVRALQMGLGGPLELQEAVGIAREILCGLEAAHGYRSVTGSVGPVIHRDLKPSNVLVSVEGEVKITDFGIASILDTTTASGSLRGTALHMAPEQALGKPVDARTDLFALACVLFELLTGETVYRAQEPLAVIAEAQRGEAAARVSQVSMPPELQPLLRRGLAASPAERFASALEFRRELDRVMETLPRLTREQLAERVRGLAPALEQITGSGTRKELVLPRETLAFGSGRGASKAVAAVLPPATLLSGARRRVRLIWAAAAICGGALGGGMAWHYLAEKTPKPTLPLTSAGSKGGLKSGRDGAGSVSPSPLSPTRGGDKVAHDDASSPLPTTPGLTGVPAASGRPAARAGLLKLSTVPRWSTVRIDGRAVGATPLTIKLSSGRHRVVLRALGREAPVTTWITIRPGLETRHIVNVEP